jgi:DNA-binding HxlR family transcriptional regulator/putative sterol carrier protein
VTARTYGQYCGLAAAMDLLGERWTMLVVRELALGPKRYSELLERLPGIGTNLLAARLKALEAAGVVQRTGASGYALTPRGEEVRPALDALSRWGWELLPDQPEPDSIRAPWAAMLMRAEMEASGGPGVAGIVDFDVAGERFWLRADSQRADLRDGPAPVHADVTARCDLPTFTALATGRTDAREAIRSGTLKIEGDQRLLEQLLQRFRLPARTMLSTTLGVPAQIRNL